MEEKTIEIYQIKDLLEMYMVSKTEPTNLSIS